MARIVTFLLYLYVHAASAVFYQPNRVPMKSSNRGNDDESTVINEWLTKMTLDDKIGQMSQIDISLLVEDDGGGGKKLNASAVEHYIGTLGIGSVLNTVPAPWTALKFREAVRFIQQTANTHGRPPVIWGLDSVHGANYIHSAVVCPQPLNLAASFNVTMSRGAGALASRDTRAAGINWLFSPLLGVALSSTWSRVYETFGEDPVLVGEMAKAMILGIQAIDGGGSNNSSNKNQTESSVVPSRAAACAKHFVGYSKPRDGHDRSPSWIPTRHLYQYFVPQWFQAVQQANVLTVMESYTETDGVPTVANPVALNYLLRTRLGFDGVLVTDYEEIRNLYQWHHVVPTMEAAVPHALREGTVDMSMIPHDADGFRRGVLWGLQPQKQQSGSSMYQEERIDESVARVLRLKQQLRMFEESPRMQLKDPNLDKVGSTQDRSVALEMVHQSIVLTKNQDGTLPIRKLKSSASSGNDTTDASNASSNSSIRTKVLVTGPTATKIAYQSGGWTGQWQGLPNEEEWITYGSNVLQAFVDDDASSSNNDDLEVSFSCGVDIVGNDCQDKDHVNQGVLEKITDWIGLGPDNSIDRAVQAASHADLVVVCVGEESYAEKPGDIRSARLPEGQYQLVRALRAKKNADTKIVLVYFGGRPRLLSKMVEDADAVLVAFLPGPDGGQGVVDLIRGRANPSGRLPITYPLAEDGCGTPYYHTVSDMGTAPWDNNDGKPLPHFHYVPCPVQWPFGHGLSYTSFAYSGLMAVVDGKNQNLELAVRVQNTGTVYSGSEVVMFFTFDQFRSATPEYKRLRAFEKVLLQPGEEVVVKRTVSARELAFVGPHDDTHYILDPNMKFWVGVGAATDCRVDPGSDLCVEISSSSGGKTKEKQSLPHIGACDIACDLWATSGCADQMHMTPTYCLSLCGGTNPDVGMTNVGKEGWGWNYVRCLESVVWGFQQRNNNDAKLGRLGNDNNDQCWKMIFLCRNVFQTDQLDEFGLGKAMRPPYIPGGSNQFGSDGIPPSNVIGLLVGLVTSLMIFRLMRGNKLNCSNGRDNSYFFAPVVADDEETD